MGKIFIASGDIATFTGAGDLWELAAPSTAVVVLHSLWVHASNTETDDSSALILKRGVTSGSGGGAITAAPIDPGGAAFGGAIEEANTVDATGGTNIFNWGWSALAGFDKIWTPETRLILAPSQVIALNMQDTITSVSIEWGVEFEELGT